MSLIKTIVKELEKDNHFELLSITHILSLIDEIFILRLMLCNTIGGSTFRKLTIDRLINKRGELVIVVTNHIRLHGDILLNEII